MAGKPEQIEGVAAQWAELKGILDGLGRELSGDLEKLANTWTGSAGREFHRRLSLIVAHTDALGEGMAGVKQGLTMMADHLRTAHKQAESPEETDDNDKAIGRRDQGWRRLRSARRRSSGASRVTSRTRQSRRRPTSGW